MQNDPVVTGLTLHSKDGVGTNEQDVCRGSQSGKNQWVIENIDELFLEMEEDENTTN